MYQLNLTKEQAQYLIQLLAGETCKLEDVDQDSEEFRVAFEVYRRLLGLNIPYKF